MKISKESAERYAWGMGSEGWKLVAEDGLSVIEERMAPGAAERRHFHIRARQFFYVLTGVLTVERANGTVALAPGEGMEIPPGAPHRAVNSGGDEVSFLVVSQPSTRTDRVNMD